VNRGLFYCGLGISDCGLGDGGLGIFRWRISDLGCLDFGSGIRDLFNVII